MAELAEGGGARGWAALPPPGAHASVSRGGWALCAAVVRQGREGEGGMGKSRAMTWWPQSATHRAKRGAALPHERAAQGAVAACCPPRWHPPMPLRRRLGGCSGAPCWGRAHAAAALTGAGAATCAAAAARH